MLQSQDAILLCVHCQQNIVYQGNNPVLAERLSNESGRAVLHIWKITVILLFPKMYSFVISFWKPLESFLRGFCHPNIKKNFFFNNYRARVQAYKLFICSWLWLQYWYSLNKLYLLLSFSWILQIFGCFGFTMIVQLRAGADNFLCLDTSAYIAGAKIL